ncbi:cytochrome P450 [Backusella circina FSU 941]|nr:cytochrome P450 [Backusella circina FSU 941]
MLIYKIHKIVTPPKNLRHLPHATYYNMIKSLLKGDSFTDIARHTTIPMINSPDSKGLYLKPGEQGWVVSVSHPEALKTVFMKHEIFPKKDLVTGVEDALVIKFCSAENILLLNGHSWKSQRMITSPAFRRSMPVKLFGKQTVKLFQAMDKLDETVDWADLAQRFTLDIIGLAGFGYDFDATLNKNSEYNHYFEIVKNGIANPLYYIFPALDKYFLWMFPKRKHAHKCLHKFLQLVDKVIAEKRDLLKSGKLFNEFLDENEKDILTLMIEAEQTGEGIMTETELRNNICVFSLAGHDTTALALTSVIYYLAKHQDVQERARQEAIRILGNDSKDILPSFEQTKQMTYINNIMKETLRLNSPTPQTLPRVAAEDVVLSGVFIPKGTVLHPNMHDVHHYEKVWKDPFSFNPDRFEEGETKKSSAVEGFTWSPFGNGARRCIGMNFSLTEQRVLLSMLLRKYTFKLPENSIHKDKLITTGTIVVGPTFLDINFKRRY